LWDLRDFLRFLCVFDLRRLPPLRVLRAVLRAIIQYWEKKTYAQFIAKYFNLNKKFSLINNS